MAVIPWLPDPALLMTGIETPAMRASEAAAETALIFAARSWA